MNHKEVYRWFELYFPDYAGDRVDIWFPNGRNSVRIRHINGQEFIFTFDGDKVLRFETIDSFLNDIRKGGDKNDK